MEAATAGEERTELRRVIGPKLLLAFIVGDILGAGIYALVGEVGAEVGGAIWTAFVAALVLAALTAFSYAELVGKYPRAAGAALYVNNAFRVPFLTFVVAFAVMASGITSAATLSRAFAGDYFKEFIDAPTVPIAIAFLLLVTAINLRGIAESVRINLGLTAVEVVGLVLIVIVGVVALGQGDADFGRNFEFKQGESAFLAILTGATLAFYALIGFEDSVNVAEETKRPARTFPRALFLGLGIAGLIYLLVTFTASAVVPTGQLSGSDGPLLEVVKEGPLGIPTKLFSFIALLAVANGALINMVMASRIVYGMSRQGIVASAFGRVLPNRRTPWAAVAFTTLIGVILISTGDLGDLADTTVMLLLSAFTLVNVSVLVLRRDEVAHEHFHAPSVFPVLGAIVSVVLIVKSATDDPAVLARAGIILLVGVVLFLIQRSLGGRSGGLRAEELA
ncbi:MAG: APC family permease [Actinomycetota bacterium]|nr:APC family permease [Actinomycetota bacterium]